MPSIYDLASNYDVAEPGIRLPVSGAPIAQAAPVAPAPMAAAPVAAAPAGLPEQGNQQLLSLLGRYFPQGDDYGPELKTARETMTRESEAFNKLLQDAMKAQGDTGPSKAEMYFRLAAAFGAPTKTGNFMESLGKAGEAAAAINKEQREAGLAERNRQLQLGLEAQKLRMTGAKEDVATLRQLAAEGMKDKRTIATELIKDYVKSGQPESSAGKQAKDEGLQPGTPEFQKRVAQIAEANVEKQMAQVNATLANMSVAQSNLLLNQQKFEQTKAQQAKLTPQEMKLKTETEDALAQTSSAYNNLKRALDLNPNTFSNSTPEKIQYELLSRANSTDPKVVNTGEMYNLLQKAALSQLKETFPGQISNDERTALMQVQGMEARSIEEREKIMKNAAKALQTSYQRSKKRLNEINQGLYRETNIGGGE